MITGGERGIRTPGTLARSTVFETAPFNHSGTSPKMRWQDAVETRFLRLFACQGSALIQYATVAFKPAFA